MTLSWPRLGQISVGISMDISHPYRLTPIVVSSQCASDRCFPLLLSWQQGMLHAGGFWMPRPHGFMASWVNSQQVMACVRETNTDRPFLSILKHHSHSFPTFSNLDPLSGPFSDWVLSQGHHEHEPTKMQDINQDRGMRWANPPGDPFTPTLVEAANFQPQPSPSSISKLFLWIPIFSLT